MGRTKSTPRSGRGVKASPSIAGPNKLHLAGFKTIRENLPSTICNVLELPAMGYLQEESFTQSKYSTTLNPTFPIKQVVLENMGARTISCAFSPDIK